MESVTVVILAYDRDTYKVRYDSGVYEVKKNALYNITTLGTMTYANCNKTDLVLYSKIDEE